MGKSNEESIGNNYFFVVLAVMGHVVNFFGFTKIVFDIISNQINLGSFFSVAALIVFFVAFSLLLQKSLKQNQRLSDIFAIIYSVTLPAILCGFYVISSYSIIKYADVSISDNGILEVGYLSKVSLFLICVIAVTVISYTFKMPRRFMQYSVFPFIVLALAGCVYFFVGGGEEFFTAIFEQEYNVIPYFLTLGVGVVILGIGGALLVKMYAFQDETNSVNSEDSDGSVKESIIKKKAIEQDHEIVIPWSGLLYVGLPILFTFILRQINLSTDFFMFMGIVLGIAAAFVVNAAMRN